jgi:hypothetical protein
MTRFLRAYLVALALSAIIPEPVLRAQSPGSDFRLRGFYLRGGYTTFNQASIVNWDDRELIVDQGKGMPAFGGGYARLRRESRVGFNVGAQFARTTLDPLRIDKFDQSGAPGSPGTTLSYSAIKYSMLLFDFDLYLVPQTQVPFTFTLGFVLGTGFQSYSVSGDDAEFQNANGSRSTTMFRYGYKLGAKYMPMRRLSIDLEFRPMGAYTSTTTYSDYLYSADGWDYYGSSSTKGGPSERFFSAGLSFHF